MVNKELLSKVMALGNRLEALRRPASYAPEQVRAFTVPEPQTLPTGAPWPSWWASQNGRGLYKLGYVPRNLTGEARAFRGPAQGLQFGKRRQDDVVA
jgi:hypothetical protein